MAALEAALARSGLIEGRLLRRYQRFLADVQLGDGSTVVAHCPNTGAMTGCAIAGSRVWLRPSDNPRRKLAYTWEYVEPELDQVACIYSARANQVVKHALLQQRPMPWGGYRQVRAEAALEPGTRIDFCLEDLDGRPLWLEVKSVTLHQGQGLGAFPDTVSQRGRKHLQVLGRTVAADVRCAVLFVAQHSAIERVSTAWSIDPAYHAALQHAQADGVEIYAGAAGWQDGYWQWRDALPWIAAG